MPGAVFKLDLSQVNTRLGELERAASDKRPLLTILGLLMVRSIQQTVRDEGSPAHSWRPLSSLSLQSRFQRVKAGSPRSFDKGKKTHLKSGLNTAGFTRFVAGKKLLRDTSRMFQSITFAVGQNSVTVGTNVVYAAAQHFGHHYPAMTIRPREKSALRWFDAFGNPIFARSVKIPERTLPARPFIVLRPEDPQKLSQAVANYFIRKVGLATAVEGLPLEAPGE